MASKEMLKQMLKGPIYMASNTYLHFYNGGKLRAEFLGEPDPKDDYRSEEWMFSTNRAITPGRDNPPDKGFSRIELPNGEIVLLKELLENFPKETLGEPHYKKFGATLGILVKIFDVGENAHIPVHWHPSPQFASKHLNSPYGKNEAWIVIGTRPGAKAWIGWKEDIPVETFKKWLEAQDVDAMRAHMHEIEPKVDDVIFLRDSFVHSLGSGLCILEPQEPTDWNILAEWEGYPFGKNDGTLGLDWDTALQAADFSAMSLDYLNNYVRRTPIIARKEGNNIEEKLVPEEASPYFQISRYKIATSMDIPKAKSFHCITVTKGSGMLHGSFGHVPIKRGKSLFVPACINRYDLVNDGDTILEALYFFPPEVS
ncbi:MAG: class I mannose-6-phosphate isomerase [bacterium]